MKITIQIDDHDGKTRLQVKPSFDELRASLMEGDKSPALYYAVKALQMLANVHLESKKMAENGPSKIVIPDFGVQ